MSMFALPSDVWIDVISNWLPTKFLTKLDTACCSRRNRHSLLQLLLGTDTSTEGETWSKHPGFIDWICLRGVKMNLLEPLSKFQKGCTNEAVTYFSVLDTSKVTKIRLYGCRNGVLSEDTLSNLINSCPRLLSLCLENVDNFTSYCVMKVNKKIFDQLTEFRFSQNSPEILYKPIICSLAQRCVGLKSLHVSVTPDYFGDNDEYKEGGLGKAWMDLILNNKQLESLHYEHDDSPIKEDFMSLIAMNCRNLMKFVGITCKGFTIRYVADLIRANPRLNYLTLYGDYYNINHAMCYQREIGHLEIRDSFLHNSAAETNETQASLICQLLNVIPTVSELHLGFKFRIIRINDRVLTTMADRFNNLTSVYFVNVDFEDCSADSWSELLTKCDKLHTVEFYLCVHVTSFVEAMTVTRNQIEELTLNDCGSLTENSVFELIQANEHLTEVVDVRRSVQFGDFQQFISKLNRPNLNLIADDE